MPTTWYATDTTILPTESPTSNQGDADTAIQTEISTITIFVVGVITVVHELINI